MSENKRFFKFKLIRDNDVTVDFGVKDNLTNIYYYTTDYTNAVRLGKLLNELNNKNEQLKRELDEFKQPNCRKCMHYSVDGVSAYCMCENGLLNSAWEMFPFEWDYSNAKNCKEYEE